MHQSSFEVVGIGVGSFQTFENFLLQTKAGMIGLLIARSLTAARGTGEKRKPGEKIAGKSVAIPGATVLLRIQAPDLSEICRSRW